MSEPEKKHPNIKEYVKEKSKAVGKFTIAGATLIMIFGVIAFIGSQIGMQGLSIQTGGDLAHAVATRDGLVVLWLVGALLALFGFVSLWSKFSHKVGILLHEKTEMELEGQQHEVTKLRKIKWIPRILFAVFLSIMIPSAVAIYQQFTSIDITDFKAMKDAFVTVSVIHIALYVIGFAIIGFFGYYLIKVFPTFEKGLPKNLDRA